MQADGRMRLLNRGMITGGEKLDRHHRVSSIGRLRTMIHARMISITHEGRVLPFACPRSRLQLATIVRLDEWRGVARFTARRRARRWARPDALPRRRPAWSGA